MKVLLVSFFNDEAYGIRSLHANLIKHNIDAHMMFFKVESKLNEFIDIKERFFNNELRISNKEIDLLINHICNNDYDIVGFSLVSLHFEIYKEIYEKIKNISNIKIIIGGWHVSLNPEKCIKHTDYLCVGEGENALLDFIINIQNNKNVNNIPNIWVNSNNIIKNNVRELQKDLSLFPIPLYNHKYSFYIENDAIYNYEPYFDNLRYGTFIGRGCPFNCTYCSNSFMNNVLYPNSWSKIRYRTMEHIKSELIEVKNKLLNIKSINFYDECFTLNSDWFATFFEWYKKDINLPFYCFFYPGMCSEEKAKILSKNGLAGVWLGIQSGSYNIRKNIYKRNYTNETIKNQAKIFSNYNISIRYDFIFNNPFESFEESLETIYLIFDLPSPFSLNLFSLKFFPNTEITNMALKAGFINEEDINNKKSLKTINLADNTNISKNNKFINYLILYISKLASINKLAENKNKIYNIIDKYKSTNDISEIYNIIGNYK